MKRLKAPANEETLVRKHCYGNIVAETLLRTEMSSYLHAYATFVTDGKFASETQKMFLNFFQKHFASATNVSPNVSWFVRQ